MTSAAVRRRAPGMSPEQRREMVIQAALPLVAEHGAAVTTAQVARAAGIGEATIFRVFADKDALLDGCVVEALNPEHVLRELRSISLEQPLAARLVEAADALRAHLGRIGTVIGALHASGHHRRRVLADQEASADQEAEQEGPAGKKAPTNQENPPGRRLSGRDEAQAATREAVAELFEPDQASLRMPVGTLTDAFLGLMFSHGRGTGVQSELSTGERVDLFLHGALASPA